MKLFNKVSILFASLALVMGAGLVGSNDAKEVKAESKTITITSDSNILNGDLKITFGKGKGSTSSRKERSQTQSLDALAPNTELCLTINFLTPGYSCPNQPIFRPT